MFVLAVAFFLQPTEKKFEKKTVHSFVYQQLQWLHRIQIAARESCVLQFTAFVKILEFMATSLLTNTSAVLCAFSLYYILSVT